MLAPDKVKAMAEVHGTPIFVVNHEELAACYLKFKRALGRTRVFYAIKANSWSSVLQTLYELGSGFAFVSMAEFRLILDLLKDQPEAEKLQFIQEKTIYACPIKPPEALEALDKYRVLCTYDNLCEIEKIKRHAPHVRLLLGVCISDTRAALNLGESYGCEPEAAVGLWKEAVRAGLAVEGLTYNVGSQCSDMPSFIAGVHTAHAVAKALAKDNLVVKKLDIGGGFAVQYPAVKDGVAPFGVGSEAIPLERYTEELVPLLDGLFPNVELMAEPGRVIVDTACTTIMQVLGKKVKSGKLQVYLNDGLFGSLRCCFSEFKRGLRAVKQGPLTETHVWGPTCDSLDKIGVFELPELDYGDVVCVDSVGSYSLVQALSYNGMLPPKVVDMPFAVPKWMRFSFPMKMPGTEYTIHELTAEVLPRTAAMLGEIYAKEEPLAISLGYKPDYWADLFAKKQREIWKTSPNLSIYITDAENEIVAVNINSELNIDKQVMVSDPDTLMAVLLDNSYREFYTKSKRQGRVVTSFASGVADKAKGKVLINTFGFCVAVMGLRHDFKWATAQGSSIESINGLERLGFSIVEEIDYAKYIDEGKVMFSGVDKLFNADGKKFIEVYKQLMSSVRASRLYEISIEKLVKACF